jgi:hypothetical protein
MLRLSVKEKRRKKVRNKEGTYQTEVFFAALVTAAS